VVVCDRLSRSWRRAGSGAASCRRASPDGDGILLAGRRSILTWVHLYRGRYEEARQVRLDQDLSLVDGEPFHGTPFGTLAGRCLLGLTHAVEGQMIQAERIYRDVVH